VKSFGSRRLGFLVLTGKCVNTFLGLWADAGDTFRVYECGRTFGHFRRNLDQSSHLDDRNARNTSEEGTPPVGFRTMAVFVASQGWLGVRKFLLDEHLPFLTSTPYCSPTIQCYKGTGENKHEAYDDGRDVGRGYVGFLSDDMHALIVSVESSIFRRECIGCRWLRKSEGGGLIERIDAWGLIRGSLEGRPMGRLVTRRLT